MWERRKKERANLPTVGRWYEQGWKYGRVAKRCFILRSACMRRLFRMNYLLAQFENGSKFRSLVNREKQILMNKHFILIAQQGQRVQLIIYERQRWKWGGSFSGFVIDK